MLKKMNLPNKLTMLRIILVPVFIICLCMPQVFEWFKIENTQTVMGIIALIVFVVAAITDCLDGRISRKQNIVTKFGKIMDPLADKLLVCSAMICLIELGLLPAWIVIIIIAREFIISGFRLIASDNGVVIAASYWGKFKTTFQMLMVIVLLLNFDIPAFKILGTVLIWIATILTVVSLIDYIVKNKDVLKEQK